MARLWHGSEDPPVLGDADDTTSTVGWVPFTMTTVSLARARKARPGSPSTPDDSPMTQLSASPDRPLLSVGDRQGPMLRARGGHVRRGRTRLGRGSDGYELNRRVRPVHDDHLPRSKRPEGARQSYPPCLPARGLRRGSS
jgi:hypothetical protein